MVNPTGLKSLESEMRAKSTRKLWQIFKKAIIIQKAGDDKIIDDDTHKELLDERIAAGEVLLERRVRKGNRRLVEMVLQNEKGKKKFFPEGLLACR